MPKTKPYKNPVPKPELTYEIEGAPPKLYLVWSNTLEMWLSSNCVAWTPYVLGAGTFTETKAEELVRAEIASGMVVKPLLDAVREQVTGSNPVVLQTIAALGGR